MKYQHQIDARNNVSRDGDTVNLLSISFEAENEIQAQDIIVERECAIIKLGLFRYFESALIEVDRSGTSNATRVLRKASFVNLNDGYRFLIFK